MSEGNACHTISVIIPVYNGEATLYRCLHAIEQQDELPHELIIADNGSDDASLRIAQDFANHATIHVRVLEVEKRGAAAARNAAAKIASGDWLAFTDADCVPDSDWLAQGMLVIQQQSCVALAGPAWGTLEGDLSAQLLSLTTLSVGNANHWRKEAGDTGVNGFASANLWINKQVFEQLQGFDASLTVSGEDYDLCARLYHAGYAIYYHSQLHVRHIHPSGLIPLLVKAADYGQAHGFLFERYGKPGLYIDMLGGRRIRLGMPYKVWVNAVSAEKKMLILLMLVLIHPAFFSLVLLYPFWISRFLCQRARSLNHPIHLFRAYMLGWLLVLRSLAFTVGRVKGSRQGVWLL